MAEPPRRKRKSQSKLARRNRIVEQHLGLVRAIAVNLAKSLPPCFPIEDLVGAGNVALLGVAERYDVLQNDNFSGYARMRIRGAMLDSVKRKQWRNATMLPLADANDLEIPVAAVQPTLEQDIHQESINAELWSHVERLPDRLRVIVELRFRDGLTAAVTGTVLGMSESRVSQLTNEALDELRRGPGSYRLRRAC